MPGSHNNLCLEKNNHIKCDIILTGTPQVRILSLQDSFFKFAVSKYTDCLKLDKKSY